MRASVICLSHTEGAGGEEIGRLLAERLGFRYADDEIIVAAARTRNLFPESVAAAELRGAGRQLEVDFHRFERTDALRDLIRDAIVAAADAGDVVIVAHAASFTLTARSDALRVLVTASLEGRVRRLTERDGIDEKSAARIVKESDRGREAYLDRFYGIRRELPTHYDVVVNTDRLATDRAVELIASAATA